MTSINRALLLTAFQMLAIAHHGLAEESFCWQIPPITYAQMSTDDLARAKTFERSLFDRLSNGPGGTNFVLENDIYIAPKQAPLTWFIRISNQESNYLATLDCVSTESSVIVSRTHLAAHALPSLYMRIIETLDQHDKPYSPPKLDDEGNDSTLSIGRIATRNTAKIGSHELSLVENRLEDMTTALIADQTVSFSDRRHLFAIINAQDLYMANRLHYRVNTGRILSGRYLIVPEVMATSPHTLSLKLSIIDVTTGKSHTNAVLSMDPLPTGETLATTVKQALENE